MASGARAQIASKVSSKIAGEGTKFVDKEAAPWLERITNEGALQSPTSF